MKVLMISSDPNILMSGSEAARRFETYQKLVEEVVPLVISGSGNISAFWRAWKDGINLLRQQRADDFIITAQDPAERWLVGWLLARKFKIPLQLQVHTDICSVFYKEESLKNTIRLKIAALILPRATQVRVVSNRIKTSLVDRGLVPADKAAVLPVYIDTRKFLSLESPGEVMFDFVFVMVSRLTREKNIDLALHALKAVTAKYPQTRLRVIGAGPRLQHLIDLANSLGIASHVEFVGWKDNPVEIYGNAHCYLLTSNYEGYGRTVIEAMAAGLPVIMTDVGLAGEVLVDNETGLVTPPNDTDALVHAMIRMRSDQGLRERLRTRARARVTLLPMEEEYLFTYKKLWQDCYSAWDIRKS